MLYSKTPLIVSQLHSYIATVSTTFTGLLTVTGSSLHALSENKAKIIVQTI